MRRALSISLILLLWLPAFAALMPGAGDVRLPFCCRRQGAHHCAMETGATVNGSSGPALQAPWSCPQFPALPATVSPILAAFAAPANEQAAIAGVHSATARREAARAGRLRAQLDRGPPSSDLA